MRFVISVISIGIVALLTSCYLKQIDLVEERGVTLDVRQEGNVSISAVSAYQEGEHLLISGAISQKKPIRPFSGWVQVTVILDNGEVFEESCYRVLSRQYPGPGRPVRMDNMQASSFNITLPKVPPSGSVIRVVGSAQASLCA
jgi:hypothetical protein